MFTFRLPVVASISNSGDITVLFSTMAETVSSVCWTLTEPAPLKEPPEAATPPEIFTRRESALADTSRPCKLFSLSATPRVIIVALVTSARKSLLISPTAAAALAPADFVPAEMVRATVPISVPPSDTSIGLTVYPFGCAVVFPSSSVTIV